MSFTELWNQQPWVRLGSAIGAALLVAVVVRRAGWAAMRRLARGCPLAADVLRRASAPMEWLVPLLMLSVALRFAPEAHRLLALDLLQHALLVALIATTAWLLVPQFGKRHASSVAAATSTACRRGIHNSFKA
jgi:hypothetical protein